MTKTSWEKRFDERRDKFWRLNEEDIDWGAVRAFIRQELKRERKRVLKEVIADLEKMKYEGQNVYIKGAITDISSNLKEREGK